MHLLSKRDTRSVRDPKLECKLFFSIIFFILGPNFVGVKYLWLVQPCLFSLWPDLYSFYQRRVRLQFLISSEFGKMSGLHFVLNMSFIRFTLGMLLLRSATQSTEVKVWDSNGFPSHANSHFSGSRTFFSALTSISEVLVEKHLLLKTTFLPSGRVCPSSLLIWGTGRKDGPL